ncbi:hypothetical protein [Brevibacillus sp. MER 51]|uniref:hypothetical protein n=1 Tax=Brevibacillus sp. MER 51 TaxID=2939560 RepID=UPI00203CB01D|nr:hypothetical protein [Brevibacillus sp. MER 51]MCM3141647.1 hypothetical protein [Brevibacillus sp. MER 51]
MNNFGDVLRDHGIGLGKYKINSKIYYKDIGLDYPPSKRFDTIKSIGGIQAAVTDTSGNVFIKFQDTITKLNSNLQIVWTKTITAPNFIFSSSPYADTQMLYLTAGKLYTVFTGADNTSSYKSLAVCIDTTTGNIDFTFAEGTGHSSSQQVMMHVIPVPNEANTFYISNERLTSGSTGSVQKVVIGSTGVNRFITSTVWTKQMAYGGAPSLALTADNCLLYSDYYSTSSWATRKVNSTGAQVATSNEVMPQKYAIYETNLYFYDRSTDYLIQLDTTDLRYVGGKKFATSYIDERVVGASATGVYVWHFFDNKGGFSKLDPTTFAEIWTIYEDVTWLLDQEMVSPGRVVGLRPNSYYGAVQYNEYLTIVR